MLVLPILVTLFL